MLAKCSQMLGGASMKLASMSKKREKRRIKGDEVALD